MSGLHIACANSVRHAYQPQEDFLLTLIKGLFRKDFNCLWPKLQPTDMEIRKVPDMQMPFNRR